MPKIRPQYHFRKTEVGLLAWDVQRLVRLSKDFTVRMIRPSSIAELNENHWYSHGKVIPTCNSLLEHFQLILDCDLSFPIILDQSGRVMDGMHRVCKAVSENIPEIASVQFTSDPEPDYINREPETLPYDV